MRVKPKRNQKQKLEFQNTGLQSVQEERENLDKQVRIGAQERQYSPERIRGESEINKRHRQRSNIYK